MRIGFSIWGVNDGYSIGLEIFFEKLGANNTVTVKRGG
jgi:hypothetical protein